MDKIILYGILIFFAGIPALMVVAMAGLMLWEVFLVWLRLFALLLIPFSKKKYHKLSLWIESKSDGSFSGYEGEN